MPSRPLLFLDVDGVLNPYGDVSPPAGFETVRAGDDPVVLCRAHAQWIGELRERFDVVWATAWNDEANDVVAAWLGIEPLDVVRMPPAPFPPEAKVARIDAFACHRPLVWMDDEQGKAARAWARARPEPTLLLPVEPAVGLTHALVRRAIAWARALQP